MRIVGIVLVLILATGANAWIFDNRPSLKIPTNTVIEYDVPAQFVSMNEKQRKVEFIKWILPIVVRQNNLVMQERKIILKLQNRELLGIQLRETEIDFLNIMQLKYGGNSFDDLLSRVNVIPTALVISQASIESGWGSSRFAQEGNNLFGIRTYDKNTPGMKPKNNVNANFKVRSYLTVDDSVANYLLLLNTHHAYKDFRTARSYMSHVDAMDDHALADTLFDYSELGSQYIEMIHVHLNNIEKLLNDLQ
jgi:Bax protein